MNKWKLVILLTAVFALGASGRTVSTLLVNYITIPGPTSGSAVLTVADNAGSGVYELPSNSGRHVLADIDTVKAMIAAQPSPTPLPTPTPVATPMPLTYKITGNVFLYEGSLFKYTVVELRDASNNLIGVGQGQFGFTAKSGQSYKLIVNQPGYSCAPSTYTIINASGKDIAPNFTKCQLGIPSFSGATIP